jgi:hypothetical protein
VASGRWKIVLDKNNQKSVPEIPTVYQIRIRGRLDQKWAEWFDGMAVTPEEGGDTLLTGPAKDQAALHGLIRKVRDLGISLVSIQAVPPDDTEPVTHGNNDKQDE